MANKIYLLIFALFLGTTLGNILQIDPIIIKPIILLNVYFLLILTFYEIHVKKLIESLKEFEYFMYVFTNLIFFISLSYVISIITKNQQLFITLLILSLFSTSPTTLYFLSLLKKDINKSCAIQSISYLFGILTLTIFVTQIFEINIFQSVEKIIIILGVPFLISQLLKKRLENIIFKVKKYSFYSLVFLVFLSTFLKAKIISSSFDKFLFSFIIILIYYLIGILFTRILKKIFKNMESEEIYYTTVPKNISLTLGICNYISPDSTIYLCCAYIIQIVLNTLIYEKTKK